MDKSKFESLFSELTKEMTVPLLSFKDSILKEIDIDQIHEAKKPKPRTCGWRSFLIKFYQTFGTTPYEGYLFDIQDKLGKCTSTIRKNSLDLAQMGFMRTLVEKKAYHYSGNDTTAWYGTLVVTEKGEKVAKELI